MAFLFCVFSLYLGNNNLRKTTMAITFTDSGTFVRYTNSVTGEVYDLLKSRLSIRAFTDGRLCLHQGGDLILTVDQKQVTSPAHTDVFDLQNKLNFFFVDTPPASSSVPTRDWLINISLGKVPGANLTTVYSSVYNVSPGAERLIVNDSTNSTHPFIAMPPTTASQLTLVSDSTDDGPAGIGAQVVMVEGLDSSFNSITDFVAMDGTTPVLTNLSFLRVNKISSVVNGSYNTNVGNIEVTHPSPLQLLGRIIEGEGQSYNGFISLPTGKSMLFADSTIRSTEPVLFKAYYRDLNTGLRFSVLKLETECEVVSNPVMPSGPPGPCDLFYTVQVVSGELTANAYLNAVCVIYDNTII